MYCLCVGCLILQMSRRLWALISLRKDAERQFTLAVVVEGNNIRLSLPGDMVMLKSPPKTMKGWENFSNLSNMSVRNCIWPELGA